MRGYDEWKTRTPEDDYARRHPEKFRRGKYKVIITREISASIEIEVEASSQDDAEMDAVAEAHAIPLDKWRVGQDDLSVDEVLGPPERDDEL